jgi:hypothetical protein
MTRMAVIKKDSHLDQLIDDCRSAAGFPPLHMEVSIVHQHLQTGFADRHTVHILQL